MVIIDKHMFFCESCKYGSPQDNNPVAVFCEKKLVHKYIKDGCGNFQQKPERNESVDIDQEHGKIVER